MKKLLNTHWERVRLSLATSNLHVVLAVLSIVALALGGAADGHWS